MTQPTTLAMRIYSYKDNRLLDRSLTLNDISFYRYAKASAPSSPNKKKAKTPPLTQII